MISIFKPPSQARSETKQENSIAAAQQQEQQWSSTNPQKWKWKWNPIKPASIRREKKATNYTLRLLLNCSFSSSLLHRKERGRNATGDGHGDARRHSQTSLLAHWSRIQRDDDVHTYGETTMYIHTERRRCTYWETTMYIQRDYDVHLQRVYMQRETTVYIQRHYYVHTESIQSVHLEEHYYAHTERWQCTYREDYYYVCTYNSREKDYVHTGESMAMHIEIWGDRLCHFLLTTLYDIIFLVMMMMMIKYTCRGVIVTKKNVVICWRTQH
jgi:hypothetical protein